MSTQTTRQTGLIHNASRAEPSRTDSAWKTNLRYEMKAFTLHAEPNRAWPSVFTGWLFLLASRRPILLRKSAVHLRPALWEQSDKNYQNRDLKLKVWQEETAECDSSCKQKCYFFIYWLQFSHVMCWRNNTKVIYDSPLFIIHSTWPSHIISSLSVTHNIYRLQLVCHPVEVVICTRWKWLFVIRLHCYNQWLFSVSRTTSLLK